jgi:hypothetical protein
MAFVPPLIFPRAFVFRTFLLITMRFRQEACRSGFPLGEYGVLTGEGTDRPVP